MPARDYERWQESEDGSWTRRLGTTGEQGVTASAAAMELAEEHGLDIATVTGSGKDGNITKGDVEAALTKEG